jgi:HSP20 family protein
MALPTSPTSSWFQRTDFPSRLFETSQSDYKLYEDDDEFVLSAELPGFDPAEVNVSWDGGVRNVASEHEHEDEARGARKTYHRRFWFLKTVGDEEITASYADGILEVRLLVITGATTRGRQIEIGT